MRIRSFHSEETIMSRGLSEGPGVRYDDSHRFRDKLDPHFIRAFGSQHVKRQQVAQAQSRMSVGIPAHDGLPDGPSGDDLEADQDLVDAILDWASDNVNAKLRDRLMLKAHMTDQRACEVCGRPLKPGHRIVGGRIPVGPECLRRLRRDGVIPGGFGV